MKNWILLAAMHHRVEPCRPSAGKSLVGTTGRLLCPVRAGCRRKRSLVSEAPRVPGNHERRGARQSRQSDPSRWARFAARDRAAFEPSRSPRSCRTERHIRSTEFSNWLPCSRHRRRLPGHDGKWRRGGLQTGPGARDGTAFVHDSRPRWEPSSVSW